MGQDKAAIKIGGTSNAVRLARILARVTYPAFEIGSGRSGLHTAAESHPGQGPLAALAAGSTALRGVGHEGPAVVLACDLGLVTEKLVGFLARWAGDHSVVPVVDGHPQPLCARWSAASLASAEAHIAAGERSLRPLLAGRVLPETRPGQDRRLAESGPDQHPAEAGQDRRPIRVELVDETSWEGVASAASFDDFDTPGELERLRHRLGEGVGDVHPV